MYAAICWMNWPPDFTRLQLQDKINFGKKFFTPQHTPNTRILTSGLCQLIPILQEFWCNLTPYETRNDTPQVSRKLLWLKRRSSCAGPYHVLPKTFILIDTQTLVPSWWCTLKERWGPKKSLSHTILVCKAIGHAHCTCLFGLRSTPFSWDIYGGPWRMSC